MSLDSSGFIRYPLLASWLMNADVTTIEELKIIRQWVEIGVPDEHFFEIFPFEEAWSN